MVLEFHELEYYEKLDFAKLEYSNSGKFLYIFKTVVDCNIVYKKVLSKRCYLAIFASRSLLTSLYHISPTNCHPKNYEIF